MPLRPDVTRVGEAAAPVALLALAVASVHVVIDEPLAPLRSSPLSHICSLEPRSDGSQSRVPAVDDGALSCDARSHVSPRGWMGRRKREGCTSAIALGHRRYIV